MYAGHLHFIYALLTFDINDYSLPLLDVGYNGIYPKIGYINNVINTYFTEHFPRALNVSKQLKEGGRYLMYFSIVCIFCKLGNVHVYF